MPADTTGSMEDKIDGLVDRLGTLVVGVRVVGSEAALKDTRRATDTRARRVKLGAGVLLGAHAEHLPRPRRRLRDLALGAGVTGCTSDLFR